MSDDEQFQFASDFKSDARRTCVIACQCSQYIFVSLGFVWKNVSPFTQVQLFRNTFNLQLQYIYIYIHVYNMISFVPIPFWGCICVFVS